MMMDQRISAPTKFIGIRQPGTVVMAVLRDMFELRVVLQLGHSAYNHRRRTVDRSVFAGNVVRDSDV